jgi:NADP-dependent 3-hydroxy acid dehydrogenase YdfG
VSQFTTILPADAPIRKPRNQDLDDAHVNNDLSGVKRRKTVVITGTTSGIGAAVARAFAASGANVFLIGRSPKKLAAAARRIPARRLAGTGLADLASIPALSQLLDVMAKRLPRIDVLVHAAGEYDWTEAGSADTRSFDLLFNVNVRAPYLLTQGLLPQLQRAAGQVVLFNSSVVNSPGAGVALYKATQHALQGLVNSLRQDLNRRGIRVSSLFPGRTATPRMQRIYAREGKTYAPGALLRAPDVAALVVALTQLSPRIEITDVQLRSPTPY